MATILAGQRVKKFALVVDVAKCTNCQNCVLATRDEHMGNEFPGYAAPMPASGPDWISIERRTRGNDFMVDVTYVPKTCNHCDDAPCVRAASDGAIYQRPDGIVVIDPVKAAGRRDLVESCPYGVIYWNEAARLPQKWIFDAHLIDQGWRQPRCVQACPTGALQSLRLADEELQELKTHHGLEELRPELQTQPRVLYRNLSRATRFFLGGTVTRRLPEGGLDNVPQAQVELTLAGAPTASCSTDSFGDFRFDGLEATQLSWAVRVSHPAYGSATATGTLSESRYLGPLLLDPELVRL
jgi:Fe-S-cluster-containing dehydrogenase component